jgi:hypothetical protein
MLCCVAELRRQGRLSSTARTVMKRLFNRVPVGIAVVPNVKTMKRHNGLTVNSLTLARRVFYGDLYLAL